MTKKKTKTDKKPIESKKEVPSKVEEPKEKNLFHKGILAVTIVTLLIVAIAILLLVKACASKEYTVTFYADNGSENFSIKVGKNGKVEQPENPVKEGYRFVGWYYKDEPFDFSLEITEDMKLEAHWAKGGVIIQTS